MGYNGPAPARFDRLAFPPLPWELRDFLLSGWAPVNFDRIPGFVEIMPELGCPVFDLPHDERDDQLALRVAAHPEEVPPWGRWPKRRAIYCPCRGLETARRRRSWIAAGWQPVGCIVQIHLCDYRDRRGGIHHAGIGQCRHCRTVFWWLRFSVFLTAVGYQWVGAMLEELRALAGDGSEKSLPHG